MDKNTLQHVDKAAYITLVVLAAIAILIAGLLLLRTVQAMRSIHK